MQYLSSFLPLLFTSVEILIAVFLCLRCHEKKSHFVLRVCATCFCCVALPVVFALGYLAPTEWLCIGINAVYYVFVSILIMLMAFLCFQVSFKSILFCSNTAIAASFFANKLSRVTEVLFVDAGLTKTDGWLCYIIRLAIFAVVCGLFVYVIFSRVYKKNMGQYVGKDAVLFCPVIIGVTVILEIMETVLTDFSEIYLIVICLCEVLYGLMILFMSYALLKQGQSEVETAIVKQLWDDDRKHYEILKENMEIINIKCHDLRHQIQAIGKSGNFSESMLEEIENSIYIYDSIIETGNEVLDVILSNFSLRCQKSKVMLTCMVDGAKIGVMEEMDVYSLFGNLLENALEYEQTIEPEENRFISLTVKEANGFLSIHCENYFEGNAKVVDGIFETNKSDKNYHGFGMKSMKRITEKYCGNFETVIADDMFQVHVLLPLNATNAGGKV